MKKITIELFRVHNSFKVKFSLVISDVSQQANKYNTPLIGKYNISGNEYIKITPHPFLTIDITSKMDKGEGWNSNMAFNMNRRDTFVFIQRLSRLYSIFTKVNDLFYYEDGKLKVDPILSEKHKEVFVCGNKTILAQACVVRNEEDHDITYEGIFLSVNSIDYFSYLTYSELEFLLYELKKIDMSSLTLQLINSALLVDNKEVKQQKLNVPDVVEKPVEEIKDEKKRIGIPDPNTIPDI